MKNPCVLVTGGAGYIGSQVVLALLDAGWRIIVVDNLATGRRDRLPEGVRFIQADASDGCRMAELLRKEPCEAILHLAGSASVAEATANPLECYRNNTCVSRTLVEVAIAHGIDRFIFASSAAVYGEPAVLRVREDAVHSPCSTYGRSKWMAESILRDIAAASSLRFVVLRYFNVAGVGPQGYSESPAPGATHLIKAACETACGMRKAVAVFGDDYDTPDGTGIRDYVHVTDLAEVHVRALDYLCADGASEVLNCGSGQGHSVRQVLDAVRRTSGRDFRTERQPRRPGDIGAIVADSERARRVLGWTATHSLIQIVESAYAWERQLARAEIRCAERNSLEALKALACAEIAS